MCLCYSTGRITKGRLETLGWGLSQFCLPRLVLMKRPGKLYKAEGFAWFEALGFSPCCLSLCRVSSFAYSLSRSSFCGEDIPPAFGTFRGLRVSLSGEVRQASSSSPNPSLIKTQVTSDKSMLATAGATIESSWGSTAER